MVQIYYKNYKSKTNNKNKIEKVTYKKTYKSKTEKSIVLLRKCVKFCFKTLLLISGTLTG